MALQQVIPLRKQAGDVSHSTPSDTQSHHSHSRAEHDTPPESPCSDHGSLQTTPPGPCCCESRTAEFTPTGSQSFCYHDSKTTIESTPLSSQSPHPDHGSLQSTLPDSQFPCSDNGATQQTTAPGPQSPHSDNGSQQSTVSNSYLLLSDSSRT